MYLQLLKLHVSHKDKEQGNEKKKTPPLFLTHAYRLPKKRFPLWKLWKLYVGNGNEQRTNVFKLITKSLAMIETGYAKYYISMAQF